MPEDLFTSFKIISLSHLSLAIDVTNATLGASDLRLGIRTGTGSTATLTKLFWPQPMTPWTTGPLANIGVTNTPVSDGFVRRDCRYRSVATQTYHNTEWAPIPYTGRKFSTWGIKPGPYPVANS